MKVTYVSNISTKQKKLTELKLTELSDRKLCRHDILPDSSSAYLQSVVILCRRLIPRHLQVFIQAWLGSDIRNNKPIVWLFFSQLVGFPFTCEAATGI